MLKEGRDRWLPPLMAVAIFVFLIVNWVSPVLRLDSSWANPAALAAGFLLPLLALVLTVRIQSRRKRALGFYALMPLALFSVTCGPFVAMNAADAVRYRRNPAFELIRRLDLPSSRISLYRTNGGATTAFGVAVRQERRLFSGVLLVRELPGFYPAHDATVTVVGPNRIRVVAAPYGERQPSEVVREYEVGILR